MILSYPQVDEKVLDSLSKSLNVKMRDGVTDALDIVPSVFSNLNKTISNAASLINKLYIKQLI
jgi:hypothetical protein